MSDQPSAPTTASPIPVPAKSPYERVDKEKAQEFFQKYWKLRKCPVCETEDPWLIGDYYVQIPTYLNGILHFDVGFVMLPIYCRVCSNTIVMNAVSMGLVPAWRP